MQKRYKDLLRTLVIELRHMLVGTIAPDGTVTHGDLDRELERLGIALDGTIIPLDALANPTASERQAHRIATAQLEYVAKEQRASARMEIVERAAYTWINRLLALRAMEARGLIDEILRNNPDYDGLPEALFILRQNDPGRASGADGGRWAVLEDACKAQSASLPGLFSLDNPGATLCPSTPALIRCMTLVGGTMPGFTLAESDAAFADPGSGSHEHDGSLKVVPMEKETKTGLVQLVIHALDTDALLSPAVFSSGSLPFETRMWQK